MKENFMRSTLLAVVFVIAGLAVANAQTDMSCADLLKVNQQLDDATKGMAKDSTADAMDKKINDYCAKHPTAKVAEAMEKALSE
jgi:hypothetical protein